MTGKTLRGIRASHRRRPDGGQFFAMPRDFLPLLLRLVKTRLSALRRVRRHFA